MCMLCSNQGLLSGAALRVQTGSAVPRWRRNGTQQGGMQVEDPWTSEYLKYKELGYSHEEVGMALGALGPDADQDSQVRPMTQSTPAQT